MFYVAFNSSWEDLGFELPLMEQVPNYLWRRWIDTSLDSLADKVEWSTAGPVPGLLYIACILFCCGALRRENKLRAHKGFENNGLPGSPH